jgi:hypothetical protein
MPTRRGVRIVLAEGTVRARGQVYRVEGGQASMVDPDVQARAAKPSHLLSLEPGRYTYGYSVYGGSGSFTIVAAYDDGPDIARSTDDAAHPDDHGLDFAVTP